jgi:hypothetical protein
MLGFSKRSLGFALQYLGGLFKNYLGRHLLSYLGYGISKDYFKDYIEPTMG